MRGFISSPRRRRRLAWLASGVLVVGGALAIGLMWPNTGDVKELVYDEGPVTYTPEPKQVRLSRQDVAAARHVAAQFILTNVARKQLSNGYDLVAPSLREGMTRSEWMAEDIPVTPLPYSVDKLLEVRDRLTYSYRNQIGLDMLLVPKRSTGQSPMTFAIEEQAVGHGKNRHWLVFAWQPRQPVGPMTAASGSLLTEADVSSALSAKWLLVPLGILSLIVLVPLGLGVRGWYRGFRASRAYRY